MIVVIGSLAFDYVMNFAGRFADQIVPEKIHLINLSFLTDKLNKNFGGTAANIAYNLSLLENKVAILAPAGKDFANFKAFLKSSGVLTKYIKIDKKTFTSNYFAIVDSLDNQIGGFYSGAMAKTSSLSLLNIKEKIDFVIISPTEPKAMLKFAKECQTLKIPYLFDPGMQLPRLTNRQLLSGILRAEILIGNDYEIGLIQKKLKLNKKALLRKVNIIITTLASKGSIIEAKNKKIKIKAAKPISTIDPVGAGDAYRAGFITGFLKNLNLSTCGMIGSLVAVYTVEKQGTTIHKFTKKQFCDRFKRNFNQPLKF